MHISPFSPESQKTLAEHFQLDGQFPTRSERKYIAMADGRLEVLQPEVHYNESEAFVELAVGGHNVKVKPAGLLSVKGDRSKTPRGEVKSFSRASRKRLMRIIGGLDKFSQPVFVTLTYPNAGSQNKDRWKRDLDVFGKRIRREWPSASFIWRMEFKARKSGSNAGVIYPHFHLLVWGAGASELRPWVSEAWYTTVDSGDPLHLLAGTRVERLRSWNGVISYVSKYLGKTDEFPDGWTGRVWGVIGRSAMPWAVVVVIRLEKEVGTKLLRLGRKFVGLRGRTLTYGMSWLMNTERVLDYIEKAENGEV